MNNQGVLLGVIVAILVIIAGYFLFFNTASQEAVISPEPTVDLTDETADIEAIGSPVPLVSSAPAASPSPAAAKPAAGAVKEFAVTGANFAFTPKEIRVKQGDTVRVTYTSQGGFHDWRLDAFNAATKVLQSGQSETVEFVANKAGQYEYYCSVGNHREMGMVGKLIVE